MTDEIQVTKIQAESAQSRTIPLFPLRTVLFPGGTLPLRIFEPRYVDMVRWCMRESSGFGVVLLKEGSDVMDSSVAAALPNIFSVGTEAQIIDFDQADNGLLGIVARGGEKFKVLGCEVASDGLLQGQVQPLTEPAGQIADDYQPLLDVLNDLLAHPLIQELNPQTDTSEDLSVSYRLADLLPIAPELKQAFLEMADPQERLAQLQQVVKQLAS
ncbi:MAG: LON peptidase substrate-binding domain-containing protein [Gammaproteobacteria bacterium]|jgi:Lon protease-like protein